MQVLYFSAPWCGPCKALRPVVESVSMDMGVHVNYINVDYDSMSTEKYSVTSVPTIVIIDGAGNQLYRNSGIISKDQLAKTFNQFK